jgi:DNA-binding XRE family transcriptional regulator
MKYTDTRICITLRWRGGKRTVDMQTKGEPKVLGMMEARKRAGLGLERCSRFSGVSIRDVIRYERGRTSPGIKNAARISAVLGVRVDEIEEFLPAVREVEAAGFVLANPNGTKAEPFRTASYRAS